MVLVCPRICPGYYLEICFRIYHAIYHVGKNIKEVMDSRNLCQIHLLEVDLMKILRDHETLSIVRHVRLHVDFSSMKTSLGL